MNCQYTLQQQLEIDKIVNKRPLVIGKSAQHKGILLFFEKTPKRLNERHHAINLNEITQKDTLNGSTDCRSNLVIEQLFLLAGIKQTCESIQSTDSFYLVPSTLQRWSDMFWHMEVESIPDSLLSGLNHQSIRPRVEVNDSTLLKCIQANTTQKTTARDTPDLPYVCGNTLLDQVIEQENGDPSQHEAGEQRKM